MVLSVFQSRFRLNYPKTPSFPPGLDRMMFSASQRMSKIITDYAGISPCVNFERLRSTRHGGVLEAAASMKLYYASVWNIRRTFVVMLQFFLSGSNSSKVVKNLFASGHIAYMRELTCISPSFFASFGARQKFPGLSLHRGYEVMSWNVKCVGGWNDIFDIVLMGVAEYSMKHSFSHLGIMLTLYHVWMAE